MRTYTDTWGPFTKHSVIEKKDIPNKSIVLNALDEYRPCSCDEWMQELVEGYTQFDKSVDEYWSRSYKIDNTVFWTNRIYFEIESLAKLFNKQVESSYLRVFYEKPEFQKTFQNENIPLDKQVDKFFEAHFATRHVSLLLRGAPGNLEAFILPVSMQIGMSLNSIDPNIKPLITLQIRDKQSVFISRASGFFPGTEINASSISSIGKFLFSALIKEETKMISILAKA